MTCCTVWWACANSFASNAGYGTETDPFPHGPRGQGRRLRNSQCLVEIERSHERLLALAPGALRPPLAPESDTWVEPEPTATRFSDVCDASKCFPIEGSATLAMARAQVCDGRNRDQGGQHPSGVGGCAARL